VNIAMLLEMAAEGMGDRVGVGPRASGMTYQELLDRSRRVATLVNEAGVERLGMVAPNSNDVPALLFGGAVAGVPFAPLNYRLADDRLQAICARIAPAILVADADAAPRVSGIDGITVMTSQELADRLGALAPAEESFTDPDQVAIWLFTSGTTGEPKAALLRHRHLVSYVLSTIDYMAADEDEATLVSVPPYHIAAMATILSSVYSGRRIMYLPQFEPKEWVEVADQEGITHAMVVPTMLNRILDAAEESGSSLPALHHLSYGGGRMPVPIIERAMNLLPQVGYVNAYGLTETSSTVAVLGPDEHREAFASDDPDGRARLGSVGRPLPTLELEIRGPDGEVMPAGETGEIYVRGDQIAGEYQGRSALDADGWFATNDGGRLDEAGFLFVEGRLDDVIVRGGENMSPGEIEDVLIQHPGVAEAAVVGVPDDEWGEVVAAAIVLEPGSAVDEGELQQWVRDHLRSSRMPAVIDIRETLPYNETGKLLRRVLKEDLTARSQEP
jgi:acyl-CoA synthetase (AMP-forming)/AMP-acid ligase II